MKQYRRSQKAVHEAIQRDRAFAAAKAIVERLKKRDPELIVHKARKDRISPFAHKTQLRHQTKFCRRASRYQRHISGGRDREARDMEEMREVRRILFSVQHGICGICGQIMEMEPERCSLDHVIPHCMGGGHGLGNYIACHKECNGDKTNDVPTGCEMVFLLFVNNIIGRDPKVF